VLFVDLRDHYGITQLVFTPDRDVHIAASAWTRESVITVTGTITSRTAENLNVALASGAVEVQVDKALLLNAAAPLPFEVADEQAVNEELCLHYRFLDLRREGLHHRVELRSRVVDFIRRHIVGAGFNEIQTPILTSSSPEGARDFLVPSRLHPGQFYALPQAPQQFKQLLMVAGFDRYFQIALCFRAEDARADRSPGEFYQLDMEMAFVEQEDVFAVVEALLVELFENFSDWQIAPAPFERIAYADALKRYGTDKPDLRFGLEIDDVSVLFGQSTFRIFRQVVEKGGVVRALRVPQVAARPRAFFDSLESFVIGEGGKGLAYLLFNGVQLQGPIAKALDQQTITALQQETQAGPGDALLFIADRESQANHLAGRLRLELADRLALREEHVYRFCWVVDFPMYERNEGGGGLVFSHNPFSMSQGGMEALASQEPLDVLAYQYDLVCNGLELSSGAIRNHRPEIMYKAFDLAGYSREQVDEGFGGMDPRLPFWGAAARRDCAGH
jgi:aspartyl-tRNA synthetase